MSLILFTFFDSASGDPVYGTMDLTAKRPTTSIQVSEVFTGQLALTAKRPSATGFLTKLYTGNISITAKRPTTSGTGQEMVTGTITLRSKKPIVAGSVSQLTLGSISITSKKAVASLVAKNNTKVVTLADFIYPSDIVPMNPPSTWRVLVVNTKGVVVSALHNKQVPLFTSAGYTDHLTSVFLVPTGWTAHINTTMSYHDQVLMGKAKKSSIQDQVRISDSLVKTQPTPHSYTIHLSDQIKPSSWIAKNRSVTAVPSTSSYTDSVVVVKNNPTPPRHIIITLTDVSGSRD